MRLSWKLGRVAGIDLFLHPSALLLYVFALAGGMTDSALATVALVSALLGSIVLHELGHALMARRYGIGTADITLYVIGGVARLERMPRSSGPELLIALAGPAVNGVIFLLLWAFASLLEASGRPTPGLLADVMWINEMLGLFNLLPAFPMDGGRVLRAALSRPLGRLRATEAAVLIGRIMAVLGAAFCLANGMFQPLILIAFISIAGTMELRQVRNEGRPGGVPRGLVDVPAPPVGFHWVDRGDGVWRLAPIMAHFGGHGRSWN